MLERLKITILCLSTLVVAYGLIGGILERVSAGDEAYRDLNIFTKVLNRVRSDYVEVPEMQKAFRGALHGMMEALDSYSSFVEADIYGQMKPQGEDPGLGLTVSKRYGYIYVVAVAPGSPAHAAGLRTGDLFESINGRATTLMSLWEAQRYLSGAAGGPVVARVIRSRHGSPLEVSLEPAEWERPPVTARMMESGLGLLSIPYVGPETAKVVASKLKLLRSDPLRGLLIDLRKCTGGAVEDAVQLADLFLVKGARIVSEKVKSGSPVERVSLHDPVLGDVPVVLLVNSGTSGAAEIFAAALKDNEVGRVVGKRTNGHGSIQEEFFLEDGSVLILTTKLLIRPGGDPIQAAEIRKSGIKPDLQSPTRDFITQFYFENSPDDIDAELGPDFYFSLDEAINSRQLEAAVEYLEKWIAEESENRKVA